MTPAPSRGGSTAHVWRLRGPLGKAKYREVFEESWAALQVLSRGREPKPPQNQDDTTLSLPPPYLARGAATLECAEFAAGIPAAASAQQERPYSFPGARSI